MRAEETLGRARRDCKCFATLMIEHDPEQRLTTVRNQPGSEECIEPRIDIRRPRSIAPGRYELIKVGPIERATRAFVWNVEVIVGDGEVDSARAQNGSQRDRVRACLKVERNRLDFLERIDFERKHEMRT